MREGAPRRTLGIVGTLVWDRIVPAGHGDAVVEGWGGIAYSLAGALASLPPFWAVRPLVRVGHDVASEAADLLASLPGIDPSGLDVAPEPNNRVELRYRDAADRTEILSGGVSGWRLDRLLASASGCDALLVNFISGHEVALRDLEGLRHAYAGPIYADLHSLFLGIDAQGARVPAPLLDWHRWCRCVDAVQMNEHEFGLLDGPDDPAAKMRSILGTGPRLVFVTRGDRGVSWLARPGIEADPLLWRSGSAGSDNGSGSPERLSPRDVTVPSTRRGDPTGCGDVWGATLFARLLAGDEVSTAVEVANRVAAHSVEHTGTSGLLEHLQDRLP